MEGRENKMKWSTTVVSSDGVEEGGGRGEGDEAIEAKIKHPHSTSGRRQRYPSSSSLLLIICLIMMKATMRRWLICVMLSTPCHMYVTSHHPHQTFMLPIHLPHVTIHIISPSSSYHHLSLLISSSLSLLPSSSSHMLSVLRITTNFFLCSFGSSRQVPTHWYVLCTTERRERGGGERGGGERR